MQTLLSAFKRSSILFYSRRRKAAGVFFFTLFSCPFPTRLCPLYNTHLSSLSSYAWFKFNVFWQHTEIKLNNTNMDWRKSKYLVGSNIILGTVATGQQAVRSLLNLAPILGRYFAMRIIWPMLGILTPVVRSGVGEGSFWKPQRPRVSAFVALTTDAAHRE